MKHKANQLEHCFGPADSAEVLQFISHDLPRLMQESSATEALETIKHFLSDHPESHNLRIAVIFAYRELGLQSEIFKLLLASLAIYPDSPIILALAVSFLGHDLNSWEQETIARRRAMLEKAAGIPEA